ncbi:fructose-2,6-bisphosphatase [Halovivax ruber XH-70]|uniref:Fructose-2,6-bisphosphatase n=1 Tax=Halovivax ruber (strain DSM 18193 / JCM 13892 / XH-70) TaxID=797302 RepID=L0I8U9_HALRX|nr:histidine phosphatase family protein [Halovivax ruber]AGB16025.1 fructose-2,6-bisphosphatase [Halovivax ruber XH-70]
MGTQTTLYFVRHAHSPYVPNREAERGLSEQGRRDALHVARTLTEYDIDVVVSSPYTRAVETVQEIAEAVGTAVITESGFRERTLAESHVADFEKAISRVWKDPSFSWEGGESNEVAQERGIAAVERTLERWTGEDIVIGTHGNLLTLILNYYDETYDFEFWQQLSMPDIYQVTFEKDRPSRIERIPSEGDVQR